MCDIPVILDARDDPGFPETAVGEFSGNPAPFPGPVTEPLFETAVF